MTLARLGSTTDALAWLRQQGASSLTTDSRRVMPGTAYKHEGKGYEQKKYRAWFVGMAPISQPRIIVAVMVDEPSNGKHFGGDVAAPVFSEVVQQTLRALGVPPDIEVKPQIQINELPAEEESF